MTDAEKIADLSRIALNLLKTTRRSDNSDAPAKLLALSKQMERLQ